MVLSAYAAGGAALALAASAAARTAIATQGPGDSGATSRTIGLPLGPSRVERFHVTEGTWMSLDVSPDGRTIVFDLLDDLYTLPMAGGKAARITYGMGLNRQPRYSPDGQRVVFVSDRGGSENVWIADRDGRNAYQLSSLRGYDGSGAVTSPTWSRDGRRIVVSQKLGASRPQSSGSANDWQWVLAAYDVVTRKMTWISDTIPGRVRSTLGPCFGPDPHTLYAAVDALHATRSGELPGWRLSTINLATGDVEPEMAFNVGRVGMRPVVSPDGRYVAYATSSGSRGGLRIRDLHSDRERWLVREVLENAPAVEFEARDLVPGYAFSPDSKTVIAAYDGHIHRLDVATGRAALVPFVAAVERPLARLGIHQFAIPDTAVRTRSVLQPALSPDGNRVAFDVLDRIWVMELPHDGLPGGRAQRLTADSVGEFYPSWSADGAWIAYSTWVDGQGGSVRRVPVPKEANWTPSASRRLTIDSGLYFQTAVLPDSGQVIAVRASPAPERQLRSQLDPTPLPLELVTIPRAGGEARVIGSLAAAFSQWLRYPVDQMYSGTAPDCIHVGFITQLSRDAEPVPSLVVVGGQGVGELAAEPSAVAGVLSPDGRRALATRKQALFELSLPTRASPCVGRSDTLNLDSAQTAPFGAEHGAARRWGTALAPWVSWSRDGGRVVFSQGGVLFVGDVHPGRWTTFTGIDVPLTIPVDSPTGTLVLHGARIITMRGDEVIVRGDLVVRGNRIIAVQPSGTRTLPSGAKVLDVTGATILPGYVDIHDHIFPPKGVHPQQSWQYLAWLASGVTTVRDPAPGIDNEVFAYRERERAGELLAPRVFSTGVPYYGSDPPIRSLDDARDAVRPNAIYFGSETFKIYYDHSTDRRARQLLAIATAEHGLNATAHTNGMEQQIASVIDGLSGIEHAPLHAIYDDVAALIAGSGTTQTSTYSGGGTLNYLRRRFGWPWQYRKMRQFVPPSMRPVTCSACSGRPGPEYGPPELGNLLRVMHGSARVVKRGGRIGMGAENDIPTLDIHYEMWLHAVGGMPNHEILRAATIVGAKAIGHGNDIGSLEPGKLADIQVLDKNPLDDIHHTASIRFVMKNGRLYRADDLTQVWPTRQPLPSIYLWERGSEEEKVAQSDGTHITRRRASSVRDRTQRHRQTKGAGYVIPGPS